MMTAYDTIFFRNNGFAPLGGLRRELDRLLDDFWAMPQSRFWPAPDSEWHPACDVEEADDHYLLNLEMPGIQKDQISLEILDNQILISGERQREQKNKEGVTGHSERRFGKFHRRFTLPSGVNAEKVEANYQDGVLRVFVPKTKSAIPRQIRISDGC